MFDCPLWVTVTVSLSQNVLAAGSSEKEPVRGKELIATTKRIAWSGTGVDALLAVGFVVRT